MVKPPIENKIYKWLHIVQANKHGEKNVNIIVKSIKSFKYLFILILIDINSTNYS